MRHLLVSGLSALLITSATQAAYAQTAAPPAAPPAAQPAPVATPAETSGAASPTAPVPTPTAVGAVEQPISQHEIDAWESDQPVPRGYHVESKRRVGMIIGGAVITGVMWGFTALGAAVYHAADTAVDNVGTSIGARSDVTNVTPLYIPVVGPFIQVVTTGGGGLGKGLLVVDGLIQAGGAFMLIYGIAVPREYLARGEEKAAKNKSTFMVLPTLTSRQATVGVVGTF